MQETASEYFQTRQSNCAQSVALAWKERKDPASIHAEVFATAGNGRAPEGLCGALHAARELVGEPRREQLTERFKEKAGGYAACRDIRRNRIMPCSACVSLAAGLLEELAE
ncbi:hypothetical protein [Tichowtungia aerotolerans]|uniref:Redox-active protein (C_GCAxxG_C_C) n=1 Tax=Tichowtungia aerotolerans TaxID=2697043 RepID=A0A6P1M6I2_9BACT|nr:hypothetical protein [Tichowtungia aerotolerans]QHI69461.1 hypothetical protein GT409_08340 [Tichowtungia aerotolerans]